MATTPNPTLTQFNQQLYQTAWWRDYIQQAIKSSGSVNLTEKQRKELDALARQHGVSIPNELQFDKTGTVTPKSHLWRDTAIQGGVAAGAIFGLPLLFGGSAPTTSFTSMLTGGGPPAVASAPWWQSLITPAISAGVNLYNTHQMTQSSDKAAELEYQSTQEALRQAELERQYQHTQDDWKNKFAENERDYSRQQYADYRARLEPTRQHLMDSFPSTVPTNGPANLVTMIAPDGSSRQVPEAHVPFYEKRGARRG